MGFESPQLLFGLLALPIFLLLALWKDKPKEVKVPSVNIWRKIKERPAPIKAIKKPKLSAALILEMLAAALGILAIAHPYILTASEKPKDVIIALDNSASMLTKVSKDQTRFGIAKKQIGEITDMLNEQDFVTIITAAQTRRLAKKEVAGYIEKINAEMIEDDLPKLVDMALAQKSQYVFLLTDHEENLGGVDDKIEKIYIGDKSSNVGITKLAVSRKESSLYDVFARVDNFSGVEQKIALFLYRDGISIANKDLSLRPGTNNVVFENTDLTNTKLVSVEFVLDDGFELDNKAQAIRLANKPLRILVAGDGNQFLRKAIEAIPDVDVTFSNSADVNTNYDIYICNEIAPAEFKNANCVLINPPTLPRQIKFGQSVSGVIDNVHHAILKSCNVGEIVISNAKVINHSNEADDIITIDGKPIGTIFENTLLLSFSLRLENGTFQSWVYYPSFPIFWSNYLEYVRSKDKQENDFVPFNSLLSEKESNNGGLRKELSNKTLKSISNVVIREGLFKYFLAGCILMIVLSWFLERK